MKLAFFVEGYTEQLLIKELALFNYGSDLSYTLFNLRGGNKLPVKVRIDEKHEAISGVPKYIIYIYDCGGLSTIRSMITHQRDSLFKNDFQKIIGIRDVHPNDRTEITKLKMSLPLRVPQKPIPTVFLLCVMETEAWFIAEEHHYLKISNQLTKQFIKDNAGIDLTTIDVESIDLPAQTLNEIYLKAGETYVKSTPGAIKRTVESLDLFNFYCVLPDKIPSLKSFISEIDNFK